MERFTSIRVVLVLVFLALGSTQIQAGIAFRNQIATEITTPPPPPPPRAKPEERAADVACGYYTCDEFQVFKEFSVIDDDGKYDDVKVFEFFDQLMNGVYPTRRQHFLFLKEVLKDCLKTEYYACQTSCETMKCANKKFDAMPH